jgi:hypothetical protein
MTALSRAALAATLAFGTGTAQAAVFSVDFSGGNGTVLGSFVAAPTGGPVSNFTVTLAGVTFDTFIGGTHDYDAAINEFTYTGSFPAYTNSAAYPICGIGACFLEIYPDPDPVVPGDYLAIDADLNNIDAGTKYVIIPPSPIPLPATAWLLLGGLATLSTAAWRRCQSA